MSSKARLKTQGLTTTTTRHSDLEAGGVKPPAFLMTNLIDDVASEARKAESADELAVVFLRAAVSVAMGPAFDEHDNQNEAVVSVARAMLHNTLIFCDIITTGGEGIEEGFDIHLKIALPSCYNKHPSEKH